MAEVKLPRKCSMLRELEHDLKRLSEAKSAMESTPDIFDIEDISELNKSFTEAFEKFAEQAKSMDMPNSVACAASFAENVNARLPFVELVRSLAKPSLTVFFEEKQKRLALQASEMLRISLKVNELGPVQPSS
jgi:hypothetical protein